MRKIIFLDLDGVLNTASWYRQLDSKSRHDEYGTANHGKDVSHYVIFDDIDDMIPNMLNSNPPDIDICIGYNDDETLEKTVAFEKLRHEIMALYGGI